MRWLWSSVVILLLVTTSTWAQGADFWHSDWAVPGKQENSKLLIRPLAEKDAERLFHSYMGSQQWLYERLGWSWPSEKSTEEQNHSMVQLHLKQQANNSAFTYVIEDKQKDLIVGALYFVPVSSQRGDSGAVNEANFNAEVTWWLTEQAVNAGLHNDLFNVLAAWLRTSWPWKQVLFPVAEANEPTRALLENSPARLVGRNHDTKELFYSYTLARK